MAGITAAAILGGTSLLGGLGSAFLAGRPAGQQTSTGFQQTQLPQWLTNWGQDLKTESQNVAGNLQPTYVAPYTDRSNQAIAGLTDMGYGAPNWLDAQNAAGRVSNYQPQQIGAPSQADIAPYQNPFLGAGMGAIEMQRKLVLNQNADQAIKTGAFAGSRQGVVEAGTNTGAMQQTGLLQQSDWQNALAAARQAQLANQTAGLQGQQLNLAGAMGLGQLTDQATNQQRSSFLSSIGAQDLYRQQAMQQAAAQRQNPLDALQIGLSSIGAIPHDTSQMSSQTGLGPSSNPFLAGIGGAAATAGTLGSLLTAFGNPKAGGYNPTVSPYAQMAWNNALANSPGA